MKRRKGTGLVQNEERVLGLALELFRADHKTFHGYQLTKQLEEVPGKPLVYSTLYRCLARLEAAGLLTAEWMMSESSQWRKVYSLTGDGLAVACDLTRDEPQGESAQNIVAP